MQTLSRYPNLSVLIASLFWGTYWIPLRYINKNGDESVWPIFLSFIILSIFLIKPLLIGLRKIIKEKDIYFIAGNFFSALAIALYSESFLRGEIAKVVLLFYLCPVWGTILAKLILKEKFNLQRYLSLLLGIIGLEIILGFDKGVFFPSSIVEYMALTAGFIWSLGLICFQLSVKTTSAEKTAVTGFIVPFFFLFLSLIPGGREFQFNFSTLLSNNVFIWMLLFAIFWLLPSILFTYVSVEILDAGRINILLMFEVILGISSAALLTQELIGLREIIGACIIILAGTIEITRIKS